MTHQDIVDRFAAIGAETVGLYRQQRERHAVEMDALRAECGKIGHVYREKDFNAGRACVICHDSERAA